MNINLSEEIEEIEKALFEIENKHEIFFNKLLSHNGTALQEAQTIDENLEMARNEKHN
jgi:predicted SprT family Zn-dependent metalloprotease